MHGEGFCNPTLPERVKKESVGDRFNGAVVRELEKKFENTHDVRRDYFTHAFPLGNLAGIVEIGGLVAPNELRRRNADFGEGSNNSVVGSIYFGKGQIKTEHTIDTRIGDKSRKTFFSAVLVPLREFQRVKRLRSDIQGREVFTDDQIKSTFEVDPHINGFPLAVESGKLLDAQDRVDIEAEKIAQTLLDRKIKEIEKALGGESLEVAVSNFVNELQDSTKLSTDQIRLVTNKFLEDNFDMIFVEEDKFEDLFCIVSLNQEIEQLETSLKLAKKELEEKRQSASRHTILHSLILERKLHQRIKQLEKTVSLSEKELDNKKRKIDHLRVLYDLIKEAKQNIRSHRKERWEQIAILQKKYMTPRASLFQLSQEIGGGYKKVRDQIEKDNGVSELNKLAKVNIDHSIIVVDIKGLEEVVKSTENKPGLRSKIILVDFDKLEEEIAKRRNENNFELGEGDTAITIPSNDPRSSIERYGILNMLCMTEDGFEMLKSAQLGVPAGKEIAGLISLVDYLSQKQQVAAV